MPPWLTRILPYDTVLPFLLKINAMSENSLLQINGLSKQFEGITALTNIDLKIKQGEVSSLIGPNGAGKTTFFNCITGMISATTGTIFFEGKEITGLKPFEITRRGISRTFQNIRLFSEMTVVDNVIVGRYPKNSTNLTATLIASLLHGSRFKDQESEDRLKAMALLDFVGLSRHCDQAAHVLSYGDQRRLEIARAMASEPKLLLLDEPAAGMNPQETEGLMQLVGKIRDRGITPFLIEHNMQMVMGISDAVTVLDHGEKIATGRPEAIQKNKRVIIAYLGKTPE